MSAPSTFYQELADLLEAKLQAHLPQTCLERVVLLVVGMLASHSCIVFRIARELASLGLGKATAESVERRLRRTLNDPYLKPEVVFQPLVKQLVDWKPLSQGNRWLVVAIDESSKEDAVHLFRASLTYQGRAIPLAWAIWEQNVALAPGTYWQKVEAVLEMVKAILPCEAEVVVVADRAFDIPAFIDRIASYKWHWVVRLKTEADACFLDYRGQQCCLAQMLHKRVGMPGNRWKMRARVFKKAGWRPASIVSVWGTREKEMLAVLSDLPPRWENLALYSRRFWIEPAFRDDKSSGWQWEASQVKDLKHQEKLLLGMAIASLVTLALGLQEAKARMERQAARQADTGNVSKPRRVKESLFTLGLHRVRCLLYGVVKHIGQLLITNLGTGTWQQTWHGYQSYRYVFNCTVRP